VAVTRVVPFVDLAAQEAEISGEALEAVTEVVREARFILGDRVERFERWLSQACEVAHAVGVASGTDALELALRALGVGRGDAVVTPAFSFVAAAEAIAACGARPVFCDVDPQSLNANAAVVREAIAGARARGARVRAIVPVHLFGLCAPTGEISRAARGERLVVVDDAAQALGGRDERGLPAGAASDAACFSFFPTKNLGAWGDGGAVVTPLEEVASRVRALRVHGATAQYVHGELGRNSRLDALQAAVLLAKASHLARWAAARQRLARRYLTSLADLPLELPAEPQPPARHAWHAFVARTERRDALASYLRDRRIETRVYYPLPLHKQPCFGPYDGPALPVSEAACRTALALPMYPTLEGEGQEYVLEQVRSFFR
jgi:dTDP-4-amino-4,6-dideoxygalactose transaminase